MSRSFDHCGAQAEQQLARTAYLARSDTASQQALDQAQKDVASARADVAEAQANYDAAAAGPTGEVRAIADAQVEAAAAALAVLERRLDKTILRAPADGIVSVVVAEVGENIHAGQPVLVIEAAAKIEPDDVTEVLRPIYERGKRSMADHVRAYIHAAFSWALKSEHDYRHTSPRRFRLAYNPAAGIPTEPKVVGTRWLDEEEFVQLYRWLECPDAPVHPRYTRAVRILMLTGQRVEEIARLHEEQWDRGEQIIDWSKTKNGKPHAIPVPAIAAELIDSIIPNKFGWFFRSAMDPSRPVNANTLYTFMWRQRDRGVIPFVTNRDLRRTWKTLAGKAGVPKEIRDRIQNHALQDVSSKSYDRWTYMPEKRAGMERWNLFVTSLLVQRTVTIAA